ncbi:serine/threonine-protein kinase [Polyangium aurulentum]|uniref:serine/threonine-protein kinase n=1 Tax=Polyangium aurulentum TaxID=2567896 RepID=UPI0010ADFBB8|nr:serine/threonine-protein kinase [Polyangium aurulentum]UQA60264.1 serine/threonine-protein kinase [Polyangium aurulentum]
MADPSELPAHAGVTVTVTVTVPTPRASMPPATMIAERYRLDRLLGRGGFGEVWEAEDVLSGAPVAVKLLGGALESGHQEVLREILALRLLRLPGVVRLLDEGLDGGRAFIVMERVDGAPFPGDAARRRWDDIEHAALALIETLARIHAAGVVHRDLKPANVLVTREGRPVLLDFGISWASRLGDVPDSGSVLVGTPAYLAPEQVLGQTATPRTDLYALGVLLYEALAGRLPHEDRDVRRLLSLRLSTRPRPLREVAPHVPEDVAGIVDRLLAVTPEDRPRSAAEVLAVLRGTTVESVHSHRLLRLGGDTAVQQALAALRAGRSVDLVGPSGTGRTRCLDEIAAALGAEGIGTVRVTAGERAFESFEPALGSLSRDEALGLDAAHELIEERLGGALAGGVVLLVDELDRIDRWSRAVIARRGGGMRAVRVIPEDWTSNDPGAEIVRLKALDEGELRPLFVGPDRIFHLREDAAKFLWARTGGRPGRVAEEIEAWVRAGIARWDGSLLAVDRETLDQLASGLCVVPLPRAPVPSGPLLPHLERLLGWIALAYPDAEPALLARAMGEARYRVEADIDELVRARRARRLPDGRVEPRWAAEARNLVAEGRRAAHRAIAAALPAGAAQRFRHLVAAMPDRGASDDDARALALEVEQLARRLAVEGRLGQAIAALTEGLSALRRAARLGSTALAEGEDRLLVVWVEIALAEGTPQAQTRALYAIGGTNPRTEATAHLEELVRGALAFRAGGERALSLLNDIRPFEDPALETWRQGLRVLSARRSSEEIEQQVLDDVVAWVGRTGRPEARAQLSGWLGRLHYRKGNFEEAARLHAEAAEGEAWTTLRIAAWLNAASALMEGFRHEEAAGRAEAALAQARDSRHPFFEARAEWLLRAIAYRRCEPLKPDIGLVEAVGRIGNSDFEAIVSLTEAAVAYRAGDARVAIELSMRAVRLWRSVHEVWPDLLARSLALAAGAGADHGGEIEDLGRKAMQCPVPGLGLQCLGMLARTVGEPKRAWQKAALPLTAGVDRRHFHLRMDVLSVDEALASLGVEPPSAPPSGAKRGRSDRKGRGQRS